jgi:hypothetical protein
LAAARCGSTEEILFPCHIVKGEEREQHACTAGEHVEVAIARDPFWRDEAGQSPSVR